MNLYLCASSLIFWNVFLSFQLTEGFLFEGLSFSQIIENIGKVSSFILITDFKIKTINGQPVEATVRKQNSLLTSMLDRIRNKTIFEESTTASSTAETEALNVTPTTHFPTEETFSASITSEKSDCSADPSLKETLNNILASQATIEPKITNILELVTLISSQIDKIDEGFIRFNDHLSNIFEAIKSQNAGSNTHHVETLANDKEKLTEVKLNC